VRKRLRRAPYGAHLEPPRRNSWRPAALTASLDSALGFPVSHLICDRHLRLPIQPNNLGNRCRPFRKRIFHRIIYGDNAKNIASLIDYRKASRLYSAIWCAASVAESSGARFGTLSA